MRHLPALLALLLVAGCVSPPSVAPPTPTPAPPPPPAAPPPLAADWRDWPVTSGTWTYARLPSGTAATFATPGQPWLARLVCAPVARQVSLVLPGATDTALTVRTTSTTRSVSLAPSPAGLEARLAATDPLLDAMAFSRGKFVVERGAAKLVLPAYAEIGRVIEDCRG